MLQSLMNPRVQKCIEGRKTHTKQMRIPGPVEGAQAHTKLDVELGGGEGRGCNVRRMERRGLEKREDKFP